MALTAYTRLRMLWGAVDWQLGSGTPYASGQTVSTGVSALPPNVGARRCSLVVDRTGAVAGADPAVMHFDILNFTSGAPDDTWTSADFGQCETSLDTFWTAVKPFVAPEYKLAEYRWYRAGPGITPPNPAVRTTARSVAGTSTGTRVPPQLACSFTFRTAVRKSWGRTYLPMGALNASQVLSSGMLTTTSTDTLATALDALITGLAANDFALVVISKHLNAALVVEKAEVDDVLDVIRRRRWKAAAYKKILP